MNSKKTVKNNQNIIREKVEVFDDKLLDKMKVLIEKSNLSYPDWGWKDPRTCLTAMHWVNAIEELDLGMELKIIFMARKASSVSRSLKKRNNLSIKQGLSIWES